MSDFVERTITINNRYGLHARPAAMFVELCNSFQSEVIVVKDETSVNGKNILDIMMLGAQPGSSLLLKITGADATKAADEIAALVENNFGES